MIRIYVEWEIISPLLEFASGKLTITHHFYDNNFSKMTELYCCKTYVKKGSIGFSSIDGKGIPTVLSRLLDNHIKAIVRSYFSGLILDKYSCEWVDDSSGYDNLNSWAKNKYKSLSEIGKREFNHSIGVRTTSDQTKVLKIIERELNKICPKIP